MSSRANKPDTQADIDLRNCIQAAPPVSFIMKAGAGSGKTTSLIKALSSVVEAHGVKLRKTRQRVACITYTDVAAGEIWRDVGNDPLVHVSTIHSFMWLVSKPFQNDIREWVGARLQEKIETLTAAQAGYGPRVQQRTRDKTARDLVRLNRQVGQISAVPSFRYGTGSDYPKGVLGHDDILKLVPFLIAERPLFRTLLARQFPFVFVDESQDTTTDVVTAFKTVEGDVASPICLGFFGDPMQKIYATGIGAIEAPEAWADIPKPENFRCSTQVLNLANRIRRDGDNLVQVAGERLGANGLIATPEGTAELFILPADNTRDANLLRVRQWMSQMSNDEAWLDSEGDGNTAGVKVLVIVHRMAAKRLGFGDLYAALNDKAPETFKTGFLEGTAWPLRPFVSFVLPIFHAVQANRELEVMQVLRSHSPLLDKGEMAAPGFDVAGRLKELRKTVLQVAAALGDDSRATNGDVLRLIQGAGLLVLDPRLQAYLDPAMAKPVEPDPDANEEDEDDGEDLTKEIASMDAFLAAPAKQFRPYETYISEKSPFWTQQGIKGAEFERVLVVLDDDEGTHNQFSYEKYLEIRDLSDADRKNIAEGKESTLDRTRRLFYVNCTRALKDLAVVLFTADPIAAERKLRGGDLFPANAIHNQADLA
ncbi:UvrD-helicase domain-containing protein [Brevundimonas sp.]|uniref:UvrD-helicase domain-containing protein n=1 Tax=Brevundimonas sp. TaxID=1871086 RepID=UPI00272FBFB7|nr:UvrD-helicase domain-containing protein [Brevundimonas sp.]MDP1912156.1 AAA family ATPase [Brevundimonas sp.]